MVRRTNQGLWLAGSALCCLVIIGLTSRGRAADTPKDIRDQQLKQQSVQVATEEVVLRIGTMLRVMEFYQPDPSQQRKTLERVAVTLLGLSRTQMDDVLRRLDKAASEPDAAKSAKELQAAHARHVEIMQTLRALLAEYETLSTLDQVADKLDKLAKTELELSLQSSKVLKDEKEPLLNSFGGGGFGPRAGMSPTVIRAQNLKQLAAEQTNLQKDLTDLLKKAAGLQGKLPQEQRDLIDQLGAAAAASQVEETLKEANKKLDDIDIQFSAEQTERLRDTNTLQRKAAEDLKDLASVLKQGKDQLAALRKAQDQLDESIRQQQELQDKAKQQADKDAKNPPLEYLDLPRPQFGGKKGGKGGKGFNNFPVVDDRGAKDMSDQQARISLDTRDTSNLLKPFAQDVADQIDLARAPMKTAEEALRERTPINAVPPQDKAIDALMDARAKVADLIAKAEAKKNDPLAALQNAAETIEKLLKEQIATRNETRDVGEAKELDKLPQIAPQQKDLANRTNALNDKPLPTKAETQKALDKAAKSMDNAAKNLQNQKAETAVNKQNDAIKSLEGAKKNLQDQIAEMEKRREDIAKLEEASQKLEKLTKDEGKIADKAADQSLEPKAKTKDLAKQQDKLTPQAKDLAKNIDKAAPKAADKINQGAEKMDLAKKELAKNQAKSGADQANKAVDRLKEAQAELNKKLDDLKAKELADQAAMKNADQKAAMQQLQKAIEQARLAMKESLKAQNDAAQKNLAEQQKQLADQAKQAKLDKAATPAGAAAKELNKGDLAKALDSQKQALDRFQQANKGEKPERPGQAKPPDPKDGQQGQTKPGQEPGEKGQQAAKSKTGEKGDQGQAKSGQPDDQGEAKAGVQQTPGQMAKKQQELIDAVKELAQKQAQQAQMAAKPANNGAMQALGQAMAGSPLGAQQNLQQAANQLGQAGQQLGQGSPGQAAQSQDKAIQEMLRAMKQMQGAETAKAKDGKGKQGKGEPKDQQAKGDKQGKGKGQGEPKDQQAKGDKQGKGQKVAKGEKQGQKQGEKQGVAQEKNNQKGDGNRIADGKVNNTEAELRDITGSDTFLQLPPRQRELIRQALAGDLPPEYAAQIQQYYLNISRGKSGIMPPPR